jgi:hypothetical protein
MGQPKDGLHFGSTNQVIRIDLLPHTASLGKLTAPRSPFRVRSVVEIAKPEPRRDPTASVSDSAQVAGGEESAQKSKP